MAHSQSPSNLEARACSLFASLEARCLEEGYHERLSQLGMARYEFLDPKDDPSELSEFPVMTFQAAMAELHNVLGQLTREAADLSQTLGYLRARDLLNEDWETAAQATTQNAVRSAR